MIRLAKACGLLAITQWKDDKSVEVIFATPHNSMNNFTKFFYQPVPSCQSSDVQLLVPIMKEQVSILDNIFGKHGISAMPTESICKMLLEMVKENGLKDFIRMRQLRKGFSIVSIIDDNNLLPPNTTRTSNGFWRDILKKMYRTMRFMEFQCSGDIIRFSCLFYYYHHQVI